jgi:oligopeptide transport system permease protein
MTKYLISRILRSILSVVLVVAVVMLLVFSLIDRDQAIAQAPSMSHYKNNALITYKQHLWEEAGYLDYVPYSDFLKMLLRDGEITQEQYTAANGIVANIVTITRKNGPLTNYDATFAANGASYRLTISTYTPNRGAEAKEKLIEILEGFSF